MSPSLDRLANERGSEVRLSILVVSYNTRELTLECLASVFEQAQETSFEVILVDNSSSDGSAKAVRELFPSVQLHELSENLGFAGANNLAAEHARGKFLLLLNPDTLVLDHAVDRLVRFAETNNKTGIVGGRTVFADGTLNPTSCWAKPTLWSTLSEALCLTTLFPGSSLFNPEAMPNWARDTERAVDIVTGCFLLIPTVLWEKLGGFDPDFFMYGEDVDLNLRASEIGHPSSITPTATIVHLGGASEQVKEDKLVRLMTAQCQLLRSHWTAPNAWLGVRLKLAGVMFRARLGQTVRGVRGSETAGNSAAWVGVWRRRREWQGRIGSLTEPRGEANAVIHGAGMQALARPAFKLRVALSKLRTLTMEWIGARRTRLPRRGPVISITFDDVHLSAIELGIPVLRTFGAQATFYVSGQYASDAEDGTARSYLSLSQVRDLAREGHEIACHTHSHTPVSVVSTARAAQDALLNRQLLAEAAEHEIRNFAYPCGDVSVRSKLLLASEYDTLRGIRPGVNFGMVDLACLRAVSFHSESDLRARVESLLQQCCETRGWLILYLHGMNEDPQRGETSPSDLAWLLEHCDRRNIKVLKVDEATRVFLSADSDQESQDSMSTSLRDQDALSGPGP